MLPWPPTRWAIGLDGLEALSSFRAAEFGERAVDRTFKSSWVLGTWPVSVAVWDFLRSVSATREPKATGGQGRARVVLPITCLGSGTTTSMSPW